MHQSQSNPLKIFGILILAITIVLTGWISPRLDAAAEDGVQASLEDEDVDYLIIVPSVNQVAATQNFETWKEQIGFRVKVVTLADIYSSYSTGDNAERIWNYLHDRYLSWGLRYVLLRRIHQVQKHAAAFHVAQEAIAQPRTLVRAFDQAGNIGQHEIGVAGAHDAEIGVQGREGIAGDLRLGRRDGGKECGLAGIGEADETGIGNQLQAQPDCQLLAGLAWVRMTRRLVGCTLEVRVAKATVQRVES